MKTMKKIGTQSFLWMCLLAIITSCSYNDTILAVTKHKLVELETKDSIRFVLLGDTGLDNEYMHQIMESVQNEEKDYVVVLGDLVYPRGPKCPDGIIEGENEELLDERIGDPFTALDVPVFLTVGNHDVTAGLFHRKRHTAREACYLDYAAKHDNLIMPSLNFTVDLGVATAAFINSNHFNLTKDLADLVNRAYDKEDQWKLLFGHHGLKIYFNKEKEKALGEWKEKYSVDFDLIGNGHAHIQQFGVYGGTLAVTTGATAKVRERLECDLEDPILKDNCQPGQLWGKSNFGYVVLDIQSDNMEVIFKDIDGSPLFICNSERGSGECIPAQIIHQTNESVSIR